MKALFLLPVCLLGFIAAMWAQNTTKPKHRDVLAVGIQLGAQQSYETRGWNGYLGNLFSVSDGIFIRCYPTTHLAVETGLNHSRSETGFSHFADNNLDPHPEIYPYNRKVWSRGIDIPLQVQWHFFDSDTRFRPYVGAGLAYVDRQYSFVEDYIILASREVLHGAENTHSMQGVFYQFAQGFSYKIGRHFIATESLQVQFSDGNTTDFGLKLGLGYVL